MSLLVQLVIALAIAVAGFGAGVKWQIGIVAARALEKAQQDARAAVRRADQVDVAAQAHERVKEVLRTEFVPITETIERVIRGPSFSTACLNDDGLRVANAAIAAANAAVRGAASRAEDSKATAPLPSISRPAGASE